MSILFNSICATCSYAIIGTSIDVSLSDISRYWLFSGLYLSMRSPLTFLLAASTFPEDNLAAPGSVKILSGADNY